MVAHGGKDRTLHSSKPLVRTLSSIAYLQLKKHFYCGRQGEIWWWDLGLLGSNWQLSLVVCRVYINFFSSIMLLCPSFKSGRSERPTEIRRQQRPTSTYTLEYLSTYKYHISSYMNHSRVNKGPPKNFTNMIIVRHPNINIDCPDPFFGLSFCRNFRFVIWKIVYWLTTQKRGWLCYKRFSTTLNRVILEYHSDHTCAKNSSFRQCLIRPKYTKSEKRFMISRLRMRSVADNHNYILPPTYLKESLPSYSSHRTPYASPAALQNSNKSSHAKKIPPSYQGLADRVFLFGQTPCSSYPKETSSPYVGSAKN